MTSYHFNMSVRGALKNRDFKGFIDASGNKIPENEVQDILLEKLSKGIERLPIGDCDNFDYKKGCLGHDE